MQWLENTLKQQYQVIRMLKQADEKTVALLRHKKHGKDIVYHSYKGTGEVYKLLRQVSHRNLPTVYEVLEGEERVVVLEEYIEGITVSDILENGLYNEHGVKQVITDVCCALEVLHTMGIVHRDIKPENIMIKNSGEVILIDFDVSRLYKPHKSNDTAIIGTTGYAAPEQFGITQSDKRVDIFAVGVMINVMLTGEHPSKKLYQGKLKRVIEKCVQINPNRRYQTATQLKQALKKSNILGSMLSTKNHQ